MRIALTGNPNSGKTTMFNALTGRNEKVGNWAGVTVDKNEALIKKSYYKGAQELVAVDLPGAYSMSPFTSEESVTSEYVKNEKPDVIINIVDATNLSRSLFFTTQLLELGIPTVVALNKSDVNEKKKTKINVKALSEKLGCPVVETISTSSDNKGLAELIKTAVSIIGKGQTAPFVQGNLANLEKSAVVEADRKRFDFVNGIVKDVETRKIKTNKRNSQDKIDAVLTNRWLGIPIFAVVMFLVFQISQSWVGPYVADVLCGWLEYFKAWIAELVSGASPLIQSLLVEGVIGGFIAVVGFLPLVMVMYFLISLLEDCGYMARVSVVLDPIFKKVGLSGKSVIPFVVGTGCAIPGVMACRTIRNERERRATAMLAPFMPCGAKLPVIALFAGAFFSEASWVGPLMYFAGIVIIFFGALLINLITGNSKKKSYFIIELPEYRLPSVVNGVNDMCSRGWAYIVKAGTIILICNTVVQIMQSFTWNLSVVEEGMENTSILASFAEVFSYILIPIVGIKAWQLAAAAITGFIAKENVVGTIAVCYGITLASPGPEASAVMGLTKAAALAYLMFNLFTPPCFAAMGAMNSEMGSAKWFWAGICLQLATGFTVSFFVYQIGTLVTTGAFGEGLVYGLCAVAVFVAVICILVARTNKRIREEKLKKRSKSA